MGLRGCEGEVEPDNPNTFPSTVLFLGELDYGYAKLLMLPQMMQASYDS